MVTLNIQDESKENLDDREQDIEFFSQLPSAISKLILARTFTSDPGVLGVIRSVCKSWGHFVRPPTARIDLGCNKYPYLVTLVNSTCKFFHAAYNHTFSLEIPELLGARIRFSRFGWLLLSRYVVETDTNEYFFFNPFTREQKDLAYVDWGEFFTMSFSSPPTSSDCFVVGVACHGVALGVTRLGEDRWDFIDIRIEMEHRVAYCHPVFYKEKCYCLAANKKLMKVDVRTRKMIVVGKTFSEEFGKTFSEELGDVKQCSLVEDNEGLLGIFFLTSKQSPHVMRMDLSHKKMKWRPVENLGNKMVYTSPAASWSDSAPTKSTSNKIYFPLFQDSNSIFYSLSTRKYHSFEGNYSCSGIPCRVQRMTNCAWISVEEK